MTYGNISVWEYPLYSLGDISKFLRVPYSTLYRWIKSEGKESFLSASRNGRALNFWDLSEAFVIYHMRHSMGIPLSEIRNASKYLREEWGIKYPLIHENILGGDGGAVYFQKSKNLLLNASRFGQVESNYLIGPYIHRIEFGDEQRPKVLYPGVPNREEKSIRIDPRIRFGQPVISGTGIPFVSVQGRVHAGESMENIAISYGIGYDQVIDAMAYANSL